MKYVRAAVTPDPDVTPAFFDAIARSSAVEEARLQDWNFAQGDGTATMLFECDGASGEFTESVRAARGVEGVDTNPVGGTTFVALVVVQADAVPLFSQVFETITSAGLVPVTPVVYRDGVVRARIVGAGSDLQAALDALPAPLAVTIEAVGEYTRRQRQPLSELSDRQREAVLAALDLGYYEHPRRATQEDVAERLGCAPNTASDHLQKAEAKLLQAMLTLAAEP